LAPIVIVSELPLPLQFVAARIGIWVARHQERTIEDPKEEIASSGAPGSDRCDSLEHERVV
jgi:hypothetical protein